MKIDPFQPLDADDEDEKTRLRIRSISVRAIIPNIVTLLALCAGLTSIRLAMESRFEFAIFALVLAAILDGIDGRVARLLKSTSKVGAELDSLADFVNFGVAPAMILYVWLLHDISSFGWIAALIFVICMALRLARFNVSSKKGKKIPLWQQNYFTGMPAPAGGVCVLLPLFLWKVGVPIDVDYSFPIAIYTLIVGLLLVSTLPVWSGKNLSSNIPDGLAMPIIVFLVLLIALIVSYPFFMVTALTLIYLGSLPFFARHYYKCIRKGDQTSQTAETHEVDGGK